MATTMFRFLSRPGETVLIAGSGLYLRLPQFSDHAAWRSLREASRSFLEPWEPAWPADDLTRSAFRMRVRRYEQEFASGQALPLFIFRAETHELVGGLTLGFIRRGAAQCAMVGYWMGEPHAGRGLMTAALAATVDHAFEVMGLHRLEAACIPDNARSIRLLEKAGFQREGYLRDYLKINGAWRDHVLFARLASDRPSLKLNPQPAHQEDRKLTA